MANKKVSWTPVAMQQFKQAIDYIDSIQNAERVSSKILLKINQSADFPDRHPKDKYRINNDGSYRAFEAHRYRITYRVVENGIRIVRFRHTSMTPVYY